MTDFDYSSMTEEEFQEILLDDILAHMKGDRLVELVPSIYSDVREYFNNEVLKRWERKQVDEALYAIADEIGNESYGAWYGPVPHESMCIAMPGKSGISVILEIVPSRQEHKPLWRWDEGDEKWVRHEDFEEEEEDE